MADIYLDNNATTRVDPQVVEAMLPYFTEQFGNPSSMHSFGDRVGKALKQARVQLQQLLGRRARVGDHLHVVRHRERLHGHPLGAEGVAGA